MTAEVLFRQYIISSFRIYRVQNVDAASSDGRNVVGLNICVVLTIIYKFLIVIVRSISYMKIWASKSNRNFRTKFSDIEVCFPLLTTVKSCEITRNMYIDILPFRRTVRERLCTEQGCSTHSAF